MGSPYFEDFEQSNGNWFTGGNLSDWAWGAPSKKVITKAGGGKNCWITGGLTGSSYNDGEYSWLQSPCYDFSALDYPYVTFKIFWETEWKYDGASMEYSVDGGNIWQPAGDAQSITGDCLNVNWFNNDGIVYLSGRKGWAGNIQPANGNCQPGNGSGGWVNALLTLPQLANAPKVIFRFLFGAGTSCNSYDGFAFDDFTISGTPPNYADFSFSCNADNTVSFFNNSALCPQKILWNFGDPASGTANTSTLENPTHSFNGAGPFDVSLSVSSTENAPASVTKKISVITLNSGGITNVSCNGLSDGIATVTTTGAGPYNFTWNTSPAQTTATAKNLKAGVYTVSVSGTNTCNASKDFTITQPQPLNISFIVQNALCGNSKGQITANVNGGTAPFQYNWLPANNNSTYIGNLNAGAYTLSVNDNNSCTVSASAQVQDINPLKIFLGSDTTICPGNSFQLNPGSFTTYMWQDNSTAPVYTVTREGVYWVRVTDQQNCIAADTLNVQTDCGIINFPSAFTPNADGLNDYFGPLGNLSFVSDYRLIVYNRWGQAVFESNNPFKKWNGRTNGKNEPGSFAWFAKYSYREQKNIFRKGTVLVIK